MRKLLFLFFICVLIPGYAFADSVNTDRSVRQDAKGLMNAGRAKVHALEDLSARRYMLDVITEYEHTLKNLLSLDRPYHISQAYNNPEDYRYYYDIVKPAYEELISTPDISSKIDPKIRSEIESKTIGYQRAFTDTLRDALKKYIINDIWQRGNILYAYKGQLGSARIQISDYDVTSSIARKESKINMTLRADMDLTLPGKTTCDYDTHDEFTCVTGSGTRIKGDASLSFSYWLMGNTVYIQIQRMTLNPGLDAASNNEIISIVKQLQILTENTVYKYTLPIDSTGLDEEEIYKNIVKALDIVSSTSILTPHIRIGDEYAMMVNPKFIEQISALAPFMSSPSRGHKVQKALSPEIRYKNGTYTVTEYSAGKDMIHLSLSEGEDKQTRFGFSVTDYTAPDTYASGSIGGNSWNIDIHVPDTIQFSSIWDGAMTHTRITGDMIDLFATSLSSTGIEYVSQGKQNILEIAGTLNPQKKSITATLNNRSIGYFGLEQSGDFINMSSWMRIGSEYAEMSLILEEKFGHYDVILPTQNIIDLSSLTGAQMLQATLKGQQKILP